MTIQAVYSDNVVARQAIRLNVVPSGRGLKKFSLDRGTHFMALVLEDNEADRQEQLRPMVTYQDMTAPIYLHDPSRIAISIDQDQGNPVIRLDKNGMVHAIREGQAVLIGNFDGVTDRIQVMVYGKDDAPEGYRTVIP